MTARKVLKHKLTLSHDLPCDKDIKAVTVFKKKKDEKKLNPGILKFIRHTITLRESISFGWLDI